MIIDLQIASESKQLPTLAQLEQWAQLALQVPDAVAEITIRMVDDVESHELNLQYRGKDKPTNVLSFPFQQPDFDDPELAAEMAAELGDVSYLGDLVVNAQLVVQEAAQQHKPVEHHWAHLVIHGTLHLQGFDHIKDDEAYVMETLESQLLATLNIANPYVAKESD
ncbi:rRNA maturation RNase YbeY [Candidatus Njordibacter sp. Uisw_039]|jgi:probable rRNA maturation factor|uniref:rRNA maturation RNase YbeY n=1 Tax=Candidatus Njordibacter sp. Uisw_039 TaxID=3230972 RepID=UPI003A424818|tara:strand:- start:15025 stop:15522 length:498 start_codon:yes stop_codon:yes gene_type:complete